MTNYKNKNYQKEYYLNNKTYFINYFKTYYEKNREDILNKLIIKRKKERKIKAKQKKKNKFILTILDKYTIFYFD